MIDINHYISKLTDLLKQQFGSNLIYVGLQGSYMRGEATEHSDIDIMVVLNSIGIDELDHYKNIVKSMEYAERSCGFICSKEDLACWNPLEICHLIHTTKDFYGELKTLIPAYTSEDIRNFVKMSVNNVYHAICHGYIHGTLSDNVAGLSAIYKSLFFILQNLHYLERGDFITTKEALLCALEGQHYEIMKHAMDLNNGASFAFEQSFQLLLTWCQSVMQAV